MKTVLRLAPLALVALAACAVDPSASSDDALAAGVNGGACKASPYDCKLRVSGGNRIATDSKGDVAWAVTPGATLRDGDGNALVPSTSTQLEFNYGQLRKFGGVDHALAMTSSNGSAAWYPVDSIVSKSSFLSKVGHVSAHGAGLKELGCYAIKNASDATLEPKKVVYDTTDNHERAGDYLPLLRASGKRSANLAFNVPGFGLGGVAIDHFPAGTKFRRLDVPTSSGKPSIDVPLWVKDAEGRYRKQDGTMKFVYAT